MTLHHDYHMARLRIARLEEALREAHSFGFWACYNPVNAEDAKECDERERESWEDFVAQGLIPPASSPRPAPKEKEPRQDEGSSGAECRA